MLIEKLLEGEEKDVLLLLEAVVAEVLVVTRTEP